MKVSVMPINGLGFTIGAGIIALWFICGLLVMQGYFDPVYDYYWIWRK